MVCAIWSGVGMVLRRSYFLMASSLEKCVLINIGTEIEALLECLHKTKPFLAGAPVPE